MNYFSGPSGCGRGLPSDGGCEVSDGGQRQAELPRSAHTSPEQ